MLLKKLGVALTLLVLADRTQLGSTISLLYRLGKNERCDSGR